MGSGSIESALRRKAEEAEKLQRQQREQQEQTARDSEARQRREAEATRSRDLQSSILAIDEKLVRVQSVLAELRSVHDEFVGSARARRGEQRLANEAVHAIREDVFGNDDFRALLGEEGVTSVDDLLASSVPEYQEDHRVKALKEHSRARDSKKTEAHEGATKLRSAKRNAGSIVEAEVHGEAPSDYETLTLALGVLLTRMGEQRQALYYQTPEGQAERKAEVATRVAGRKDAMYLHVAVVNASGVNSLHTVERADTRDAQVYGEAVVKGAVKEHYSQKVDRQLAEQAQRSGQAQLSRAVEVIDKLPEEWNEVANLLPELRRFKGEAVNHLAGLIGNDPDAPVFKAVRSYGSWHRTEASGRALAAALVDLLSLKNSVTMGLRYSDEVPEEALAATISRQAALVDLIRNGNVTVHTTELENPKITETLLREQLRFYSDLLSRITTPVELLAKVQTRQIGDEFKVKTPRELGIAVGYARTSEFILLKDDEAQEISKYTVGRARSEAKRFEDEREKLAAKLREQVGDKVDMDWASAELSAFNGDKQLYDQYRRAEEVLRIQNVGKEQLPILDVELAPLAQQMGEPVSVRRLGHTNRLDIRVGSIDYVSMQSLATQIDELGKKVVELDRSIQAVEDRAKTEGDGLTGGKRRKRENEISAYSAERAQCEQRLDSAGKEYAPMAELAKNLRSVDYCLATIQDKGLNFDLPRGSISLGDFVNSVKAQLSVTLTPEQERAYALRQELQSRVDVKQREYRKKYGY